MYLCLAYSVYISCCILYQEEATKFPRLSGKCLSGKVLELPTGHVSLILISLRAIGMVMSVAKIIILVYTIRFVLQRMCEQYRLPFEQHFKNGVPIYELLLIDKFAFKLLKPLIERNLRKTVPHERQVFSELSIIIAMY